MASCRQFMLCLTEFKCRDFKSQGCLKLFMLFLLIYWDTGRVSYHIQFLFTKNTNIKYFAFFSTRQKSLPFMKLKKKKQCNQSFVRWIYNLTMGQVLCLVNEILANSINHWCIGLRTCRSDVDKHAVDQQVFQSRGMLVPHLVKLPCFEKKETKKKGIGLKTCLMPSSSMVS